jgi:hypothetical protein
MTQQSELLDRIEKTIRDHESISTHDLYRVLRREGALTIAPALDDYLILPAMNLLEAIDELKKQGRIKECDHCENLHAGESKSLCADCCVKIARRLLADPNLL